MAADTKTNPDANDPAARLAILLFRHSLYLDQGDFARAASIAPSQLSEYERGIKATPRKTQEKAAVAAGFPIVLLDSLLQAIRSYRVATHGKSRADRVFTTSASAEVLALVRLAADVILVRKAEASPAAEDRAGATALWARLESCTAAQRRLLVEELEEYWSWELSERVAAESITQAPAHPQEAMELAELALLIAERAPGR
jgi:hypothetical protein